MIGRLFRDTGGSLAVAGKSPTFAAIRDGLLGARVTGLYCATTTVE
jgi:hypothetical protein